LKEKGKNLHYVHLRGGRGRACWGEEKHLGGRDIVRYGAPERKKKSLETEKSMKEKETGGCRVSKTSSPEYRRREGPKKTKNNTAPGGRDGKRRPAGEKGVCLKRGEENAITQKEETQNRRGRKKGRRK